MKTLLIILLLAPICAFSQMKYDLYTSWEYYNGYVRCESGVGVVEHSQYGLDMKIKSGDFIKMDIYVKNGASFTKIFTDTFQEDALWEYQIQVISNRRPIVIVLTNTRGAEYYWAIPSY